MELDVRKHDPVCTISALIDVRARTHFEKLFFVTEPHTYLDGGIWN